MEADKICLEEGWKNLLINEFKSPYMQNLKQFLLVEKTARKQIFPKGSEYFAALDLTPFEKVQVVILGQDPYHGPGQAHGLCFSVRPGVQPPPSLINIYKELKADLNIEPPDHGFLVPWAQQGVLLLNSVLTVECHKPASHQNRGWEKFTDQIIRRLNDEREGIAFLLWGSYAQKKGAFIDRKRHLVIESAHPSPLSAHRGFFGSRPFSKINAYLSAQGKQPIDWRLPKLKDIGSVIPGENIQ